MSATRKDTDYISMSSYVRVQEKRLLDKGSMERIAEAPSLPEALRMLSQNSDYDFGALRRPEEYETVVRAELGRAYKMAYGAAATCPELPDILGCKYDYHNVKCALKAHLLGVSGAPFVDVTPLDPAEIVGLVEKPGGKTSLPEHIAEAVATGLGAFDKSKNPQDIDILLDKQMYRHMLRQAEAIGNDFITGYVKNAIDFYNLKAMVRVRSMQKGTAFLTECLAEGGNTDPSFFPANYGKNGSALSLSFAFKNYGPQLKTGVEAFERSGDYSELERLLDNFLLDYVKNAKRISFGPEILFAYLVSKENEIRQVRIVAACKQNGIPADTLKERLRDNYA